MNRAELYYTETCRRADEQYKARQHFDTIATAILGLSTILLGLTPFASSEWTNWTIYPIAVAVISFLVVSISTIYSLWLRKWEFQPGLHDLGKSVETLKYKDRDLVLWSAKWMADSITSNRTPLTTKAICLRIAYIALAIEAISIIVIFALGDCLCS